jgi:hypothetical protein
MATAVFDPSCGVLGLPHEYAACVPELRIAAFVTAHPKSNLRLLPRNHHMMLTIEYQQVIRSNVTQSCF